ncbi:RNA demethylase ALKBH10B-like [Rutidosis leptorrhynchoides]|uniref:RNA demethylase ALKBH10B-like n=1 Tax=Rutidosis leptorrhynchoides TaxID=125765 RepID=UPI003A9A3EEA
MSPAAGVSSVSDLSPAVNSVTMTSDTVTKDATITWFRGEFAAANAIIDTLCGHLSRLENGKCEYESVFRAIHRRRLNWIPILHMQKFFSIADVTLELQKLEDEKMKCKGCDDIEEVVHVSSLVKEEVVNCDKNGGDEAVDDDSSPKSEITDTDNTGSKDVQMLVENNNICSNQEDLEARKAQIQLTKGFIAKESVRGHMVNVVRGLKLYENILTDTEFTRLTDYVHKLRVAGKNGELSGETFIMYNQQSKAIKRELIQFGAPIFDPIKDDGISKSQNSNIEPIPAPLEGVIDQLIKYSLISENRRPNSCIINFFDEGEFSQPFLKPPHLDQPISSLVLSDSVMGFGRTLVCDKDGNYKGPLMISLKKGSLLVMRGNSADMARHAMCQSPTKRISVTFFKVRMDSNLKNSSATGAITVWQPSVPTPYPSNRIPNGTVKRYDSLNAVSKWGVFGAPQLLMLPPVRPMVLTPRRLPCGGTGVFLPWSGGSRKPAKNIPPRAQRERLLTLPPPPAESYKVDLTSVSSLN